MIEEQQVTTPEVTETVPEVTQEAPVPTTEPEMPSSEPKPEEKMEDKEEETKPEEEEEEEKEDDDNGKDEKKDDDDLKEVSLELTVERTQPSSESSLPPPSEPTVKPKKKISASLALKGSYHPATFTSSPPPPPEGYSLSADEWADLVEGSRKMKLLLEGRAATIKTGDLIVGYDDVADEADDARSATRALAQRREAELAARAQQEQPKGFWGRARATMGAAFSSVAYAMNRVVAYVQDEAKRESRERSAKRFEALNLTEEQRAAAGALLADHYCRAVVRAPQKAKRRSLAESQDTTGEEKGKKIQKYKDTKIPL